MLTFRQFLTELIDRALKKKVHTNPSVGTVAHALKHSEYGELRYVHNTKTKKTHVADAGHFIHQEIAHHAGEHEFNRNWSGETDHYNQDHFHAGVIKPHHIDTIKKHGLKDFLHKIHHNMPNVRDYE